MLSVRCDNCGKKALIAASKCPQCGHLFDLRDSRGELVPLAHCSRCGSDYPARQGFCRWCGPIASRPLFASSAWKGIAVGAVACVAVGISVWLWSQRAASPGVIAIAPAAATPAPALTHDSIVAPPPAATEPADTTATYTALGAVAGDTVPAPIVPRTASGLSASTRALSSPRAAATALERETPPPSWLKRSRVSVRAVVATTQAWTDVRAAADDDAPIVGSIGPDTRVQLGESRGAWIRLRTGELSGWVERRQLITR